MFYMIKSERVIKMIEYRVIESNRKTVSIQVTAEREVLVRAPFRYSRKKIERFVCENIAWIEKAIRKQKENNNYKICLSEQEIRKLKVLAERIINEKVLFYSEKMGLTPNGVKITSAQKRFGSCNSNNSLCFSYILMLYPEEAIDYVVVHELAHIKFHNHSADFYNLIKKFIPDYKLRENLLKGKQTLPEFSEG